jgi:hypothetical protein
VVEEAEIHGGEQLGGAAGDSAETPRQARRGIGRAIQSRGELCNEFLSHRGLIVAVWSGRQRYQGSQFDIGYERHLVVTRMVRWKQWKLQWEKISKIEFHYSEAPSARLLDLIRTGRQRCDERARKESEVRANKTNPVVTLARTSSRGARTPSGNRRPGRPATRNLL